MENRTESRIKFFAKFARGEQRERRAVLTEGGGWKEILKKPKKAKKTLAFRFRLCYYKQVAGRQRQTKENPGVAKFGIALEWGSRGLEFESQHSDQKFRKSSYLGDFRNFFV